MCTYNNRILKQTKGGAIGVGIAGDVSNVFMIWWDRRMNSLCMKHDIELKMYSRYVDDSNLVIKTKKEGDEEVNIQNREERTMKR